MLIAVRRTDCPSFFVNDIDTPSLDNFPYQPLGQARYMYPATRSDSLANFVNYLNSLVPVPLFTTTTATTIINSTSLLPGAPNISTAAIIAAAGAVFPTEATLTSGATTAGVVFTAVTGGTAGNSITITSLAASGSSPLSVSVSGTAITIQLSTGDTANEVIAAVNAYPAAAALVVATPLTTGAGTFVAAASTPLAGGSAAPGASLTTAQALYIQRNFLGFYLVETGQVLMSLYRGSLSRYASGSYSYLGVSGAAVYALTDAGNVQYVIA